ncbi:hypothetical protein EVA_15178 [gut metagenome]|uniref:Uncharacterized protein n=1 Tax=gut metagenome TaxID=749906 RepID=J9FP56_9ZZZZ
MCRSLYTCRRRHRKAHASKLCDPEVNRQGKSSNLLHGSGRGISP